MFIVDWWNSLSVASQVFACVALPSTLVLLIQTVMLFFGVGEDGVDDIPDDLPDDLPDGTLPDVGDGVFGEQLPTEAPDGAGQVGLRIFTLRGIVAFLVVFGWLGMILDGTGAALYITLPVSIAAGGVMMLLLSLLFRSLMRLRGDGNTDNRNAIGVSGKVHLTVPPARTGEGKVHLMLQGSYVERGAVTDDPAPIPTGSEVVVVAISGQTDLVVRRK